MLSAMKVVSKVALWAELMFWVVNAGSSLESWDWVKVRGVGVLSCFLSRELLRDFDLKIFCFFGLEVGHTFR